MSAEEQKERQHHHYLTEEERIKVTAQVDYFLEVLANRYKIQSQEVIETIQWVKERKDFTAKLKTTALLSILGVVISAVALTLWEGAKSLIAGRQ